ncbi:MAG: peptidase S41 [Ekhidna sp.]|nr:peptidase S41 [Ekhidna sp.]
MKLLLSYILILLSLAASTQSMFSKQQVLSDFDTLKGTLEQAQYDLYYYTEKSKLDSAFQSLRASVDDSLTYLETSNLFQTWMTSIKNGHTAVLPPVYAYRSFADGGGTLFPLELAFENGKALIRKNLSAETALEKGKKIISINGTPIEEVLSEILKQIPAERPYFQLAKLEYFSFPRYYWIVFGESKTFEIVVKESNSEKTETFRVPSIKVWEDFEDNYVPIVKGERVLEFYDEAAYLNPGNLSGDKEQYRNFIDSAFQEIKDLKSPNLIIDLRNNGGGDDAFSDYLVSYIAKKPFKWNSSFTLKSSAPLKKHIRSLEDYSGHYWQTALQKPNGEVYSYDFDDYEPQDKKKRYSGNVYVLINRHSYSQSAVTAAQMQDYGLATIVGEETGEYPTLIASIFTLALPETGIAFNISKGRIVRVSGDTSEQGVIPDMIIQDHLLDEEDEILEGLLNRLSKGK